MQYFFIIGIFANAQTVKKLMINVRNVLNGIDIMGGIFIENSPIL